SPATRSPRATRPRRRARRAAEPHPRPPPAQVPRRPGLRHRPTPARATRVARIGAVRAANAGGGIRGAGVSSITIVGCPDMPGVAGVLVNLPRAVLTDPPDNGAQGPDHAIRETTGRRRLPRTTAHGAFWRNARLKCAIRSRPADPRPAIPRGTRS